QVLIDFERKPFKDLRSGINPMNPRQRATTFESVRLSHRWLNEIAQWPPKSDPLSSVSDRPGTDRGCLACRRAIGLLQVPRLPRSRNDAGVRGAESSGSTISAII